MALLNCNALYGDVFLFIVSTPPQTVVKEQFSAGLLYKATLVVAMKRLPINKLKTNCISPPELKR